MFTRLRIKNFKAWRDTGDVRLAPLTVLFGTNSSGKSSLHQFLLMLKQTAESPDRRRVLQTGDGSTPVDLGGFADLINGRNLRRALEFELAWDLDERLEIRDVRSKSRVSGDQMSFEAKIKGTGTAPPKLHVDHFRYTLGGGSKSLTLGLRRDADGGYKVTSDGLTPVKTMGRKWPVSAPSHFYGFPDDVQNRFQNLAFASDLTLEFEQQLERLAYLGPLRERPGRLYRWSGEEPGHVGWSGERTVEALLAGQHRCFNMKPKRKLKPLQVLVAEWLEWLGVIDAFSVKPIGAGREEYEVRVKAPGRSQEVLLTDVGFGVSQLLPVITQCFYAPPRSTLIFEQPEIHLHPAVQAGLGDLFIDAVHARENNRSRDVQVIVESHSEHLLRRILLRVAEGEIGLDDVALYFITPGSTGSQVVPLELDELGNVHNWPTDFFGDQTADMIEQTRAARRRRQASSA